MNESVIEQAALDWLELTGWSILHGPDIAPDMGSSERRDYGQVVLEERLREALARLNPQIPAEALEEAFRKLTRPEGATLEARNKLVHRMLVDGVTVEYRNSNGDVRGAQASVFDFEKVERNDWLAVNQFSIIEHKRTRRADIVLFVNGLAIAVMELKNAADEGATIWTAYSQFQTYKNEIPSLFTTNQFLCISDGVQARVGTLTAGREWFKPWRTVIGDSLAHTHLPELQVVIEGMFNPRTCLDLVRDFIVFESAESGALVKKIAGYHQYHAVQVALEETLRAAELHRQTLLVAESTSDNRTERQSGGRLGDRRIGVVWHTQGSGKSLTMAFYAARIIREPSMENPTIVVLTDRNDLDDQLFGTFSQCSELLRQPPVQADSRSHLRDLLSVRAGGVVFSTIHKFFPEEKGDRHQLLSARRNIVVIADEAHRSQYDFIDGYARHMRDALPNASFIGFTGTPVELTDANTRAVFGDYISVYDIQRAVKDGATVPIYYESRLAKLVLNEAERPTIDPEFEEATEGEEVERKEKLKSKWAQLEAVVGADKRIQLIAADILNHMDNRFDAMPGKAMIVCMSRRICVKLYEELVRLRPSWADDDDNKGAVKVIMTGSASETEWQQHIRSKRRRKELANRFRDSNDPFKLVIVRDMWLTGFDAKSLHTMYIDKPMRGHGLMQAIARVNRVFRDKPGGLVVDYLGLAKELKEALTTYTESGGTGRTAFNQEEAVAVMTEKYEQCLGLFHGFDWSLWLTGTPVQRLALLPGAQEHILAQESGKERLLPVARDLRRAFALAVPHEKALRIRDEIAFFQSVQAVLSKRAPSDARPEEDIDEAVQKIISRAVAPEGVLDIFAAAGLKKPDISILSDEFLAEVQGLPQKNLAVELLRKLLSGEIRTRGRKNIIQGRSFSEMLEKTIRRYQNRAIEAAQVIEELISLAKEMQAAQRRGEQLDLSDDEIAFYDALETNDSAVAVLGDKTLKLIAQELVKAIRTSVTIDWTTRENVRAQLRVLVKRILRKHGYPPDKQEKATQTVLEQAALLSQEWAVVAS
ncbi:MAG: type I restriction endonuclease subunit R [Candidatus Obscuribacterales bacterium]|nr:type I restriction endonuclease subunit R [Candidatus Obscuribacterales bacterium]